MRYTIIVMHVAISGWLLGSPSGANRRLLATLEHVAPLLEGGERVTVLHGPGFAPPAIERIDWHPVAIAASSTLRRVRGEWRHLAKALAELGADGLDHGFLPLPAVNVPCCLVIHDLRAADGLTRWPRWLARRIVRRSCARAAAVVVPSRFTAERVRTVAPGCTPIVIANGAEPALEVQPAPSRTANGYLLHVGHLEPRKNLAVVLQALAKVPAGRRPDLVLVGRDAGCESALRALASRLGIDDHVRIAGVLAEGEVNALHAGARAVVVPSTYEGFGLPALEALSYGRPVLVAEAGALPEVVGAAGTCLPPADVTSWAAAIEATRPEGDDGGDARRAWAKRFSWQETAAQTLAVWRRLGSKAAVSARGR